MIADVSFQKGGVPRATFSKKVAEGVLLLGDGTLGMSIFVTFLAIKHRVNIAPETAGKSRARFKTRSLDGGGMPAKTWIPVLEKSETHGVFKRVITKFHLRRSTSVLVSQVQRSC